MGYNNMNSTQTQSDKIIKMYGANWCADCFRAKKVFEQYGIKYEYIDIDKSEEAKDHVRKVNPNGDESIPVIEYLDETIQIEPSYNEIVTKLKELGLIKLN